MLIALVNGYAVNQLLFKDASSKTWLSTYLLLMLSALTGSFLIIILAVFFIVSFAKRKKYSPGVIFIATLPMLPSALGIIIGGMGINYLFTLYYPLLLTLSILVAALINSKFKKTNNTDKLVILYVVLLCLLSYRIEGITSIMRYVFITSVSILLPYFVFSLAKYKQDSFELLAISMVVVSVFLSIISFYEYIFQWTYFKYLFPRSMFDIPSHYFAQYSRDGNVRAVASVGSPIPLAYYLIISYLFGCYLYSIKKIKKNSFYFYSLIIIVSVYLTGSRAGVLSLILIPLIIFRLSIVSSAKKKFIDVSVILIVGLTIALLPNLNEIDQHGTFQYRVDLINNSYIVFKNNFWFGSNDYLNSLENMRQGQGIIDIVNTYVSIGLRTGIVGLMLFIFIFITASRSLSKELSNKKSNYTLHMQFQAKLLLSVCIITFFYLGTVSSVGIIPYVYWSMLGIASSFIKYKDNEASTPALIADFKDK